MKAHTSTYAPALAGAVVITSIVIGELLAGDELTEDHLQDLEDAQPFLAKIGRGDFTVFRRRPVPDATADAAARLCGIIDELLCAREITPDTLDDLEQLAPHLHRFIAEY